MKAYRIATGARIELLGDPVREGLIHNLTLAEHQVIAAQHAHLALREVPSAGDIREDEPHVRFPDDLYLSWGMLSAFLEVARQQPARSAVLALRRVGELDKLARTQDVTLTDAHVIYPVEYVVPGDRAAPRPAVVDVEQGPPLRRKLPRHVLPAGETVHYVTSRSVLQIVTPLHLQLANLVAILNRAASWEPTGVTARAFRVARWLGDRLGGPGDPDAPPKAPGPLFYRFLQQKNQIGKNCDIHPSAVVEGCILGDNVRVGAKSYLQFCTIGDDVEISPFAGLISVVLGSGCHVVTREWITFSTIYPGCFLAPRYLQFAFVGRDAQLFPSMYYDYRLDGRSVSTRFRGQLVDSGFPFIGPIIGHRAKIAGGLLLAAGRMVPNDAVVLPNPDTVVSRFPLEGGEGETYVAGRPGPLPRRGEG